MARKTFEEIMREIEAQEAAEEASRIAAVRAESDRIGALTAPRIAAGLCITVRERDAAGDPIFACDNSVSAEIRATGCGICQACCDKEDEEEGRCDGLAAARIEEEWYT